MNIVVCDDDREDRRTLERCVAKYSRMKDVHVSVRSCPGTTALLEGDAWMAADVIFMDILMDNAPDGMTTAQQLRDRGYNGCFVFVTASREHALSSFQVNVVDYLVKPVHYERFALCMRRLCDRMSASLACLTVPVAGEDVRIPLCRIYMIETGDDHCVLIHLKERTLRTALTISAVAAMLAPYANFLRCHRSYIINMSLVEHITGASVVLRNGRTALMTIRNAASIRRHIEGFLLEQSIDEPAEEG